MILIVFAFNVFVLFLLIVVILFVEHCFNIVLLFYGLLCFYLYSIWI